MPLAHVIEIPVVAVDEEDGPVLRVTLSWAGELVTGQEADELAGLWLAALRELARAGEHGVGGHTPPDLPLVPQPGPDRGHGIRLEKPFITLSPFQDIRPLS